MNTFRRIRKRILRNSLGEAGQTLVEYGLLVTLLARGSVIILNPVGKDVAGLFTSVSTSFQEASSS